MLSAGDKVVFIGDSRFNQAYGSTNPEDSIPRQFASLTGLDVINFSCPGQKMGRHPTYPHIPQGFVDSKYGINWLHGSSAKQIKAVFIMLGINDWSANPFSDPNIYGIAYLESLLFLLQLGIPHVYAISDMWAKASLEATTNTYGHYIDDYRAITVSVAGLASAAHIDGKTIMAQDNSYFYDNKHTNALGSSVAAAGIYTRIQSDGII